jgi:hypothetical protein
MIENFGTIKVGCVRGVEELRRLRFRGFEDCDVKEKASELLQTAWVYFPFPEQNPLVEGRLIITQSHKDHENIQNCIEVSL